MKNLTQYFEGTIKSGDDISTQSDNDTKGEADSKNGSKRKRNRVKIKISLSNAQERVCDILESSSDMIDKTPSPFTKVKNTNEDFHGTPTNSLTPYLLSATKHKKSPDERFNYLALDTHDISVKHKRQSKKGGTENGSSNNKRSKDQLSNKINDNNDVHKNGACKTQNDVHIINVIDVNSNDGIDSNGEGSNAFQILMSRNKLVQSTLPINDPSPVEDVKKSEEYKEKLKRSKEKLTALAEKKGYTKRKLAEMEESEKIEKTIQNRIKLFKGEDKEDNHMAAAVSNHKQSPGNLLNYFSKAPADIAHNNVTNMSTIIVKADVHEAENSVKHGSYRPCSNNNEKRLNKKSKKVDLKMSHVDDINIIESENINISSNRNKQQGKQQSNNNRCSLRIKQKGNISLGESSDEEIFSARSKFKLDVQSALQPGTVNGTNSENLGTKKKSKKGTAKEINPKIKLKSSREVEITKADSIIQREHDSEHKLKEEQISVVFDKQEETSTKSKKLDNTKITEIEDDKIDQNDCIIVSDSNSKRKTADKLAPLFTKRRKPDPEVLEARRLFLQPDMTNKDNKSVNAKSNFCGRLPFPLISHITQLSNINCNESTIFNIPTKMYDKYIPFTNVSSFKHLMDRSKTKIKTLEKISKPKIQEVLADIEERCSDTKQLWNSVSIIVKGQSVKAISPKAKGRKRKYIEKKDATESKSKEDQWLSWPDKYRPKRTQEVVGNEYAAMKLREWLMGWKAAFTNADISSGDEFYSSDSNQSKIIENNQVAVLLGPHGCGKTASVYAVAEEFGYSVLELNASSKRSGKKILKELEEATKSHRIKKDEILSTLCKPPSDEILPKRISQNSLILIEDVDIIFEEDEGFISATYQLASNTKRPIVMTCRDVCPHLSKMAPQQNRIYFQDVVGSRVFALLELITLAETGYRLPPSYITELLQSGDLRKAMIQLQYLLLSGPPRILEQSINFKNAFWQNLRLNLYKPAIKVGKKRKKKKATDDKVSNDNKSIIGDLANKLDNVALVTCLVDVEDSALNLWQIRMQPSLSLIENVAPYSSSSNICLEIAEWIGNKVTHKDELIEQDGIQWQNGIMLRKQLNEGVNMALSQTTSFMLDRHIIATDYLPSVRNICRAEETRASMNNKRGNRFFHYLLNLKSSTALLKPNILAAACKMMNDKIDNNMHANEDNTSHIQ